MSFNPLSSKKIQHKIASCTFVVVALLHTCLAIYLIKAPEVKEIKPIFTMTVEMVLTQQKTTQSVPALPPPVVKIPEKPKLIKPQPTIKKITAVPPKTKEAEPVPMANPTAVATPQVSTPTTVSSSPSSTTATAPTSNNKTSTSTPTVSSGVIPILRVEPEYPPIAKRREIEGWVKIEFSITPDGAVKNAVVIDAEPENTFNEAAITAIEQWKFKAKIVDGIAISQRAVQKLQFKLDH